MAATLGREKPPSRPLPNGRCNYRDQQLGACGCNQFWDKSSAELHQGNSDHTQGAERSTWCVCGHHACFHIYEALQFDGRCKLDAASQCSTLSASGLPKIPSVCLLPQSHDQGLGLAAEAGTRAMQSFAGQATRHFPGLGFSLKNTFDRPQSVSSTVPDEINKKPHGSFGESEIASTRANSVRADMYDDSPLLRGPLEQILEYNRTLHLNVEGDTIPDTYIPDDYVQSATEVATPSVANTPDLAHADQAVQETKMIMDTLTRLTSRPERLSSLDPKPASATASAVPLPHLNSPAPVTPHEQLQRAVGSASPQVLQKLISYLNPIHNLLNTIPNVASSMREFTNRLEHLENQSFNHVQPEDFQQQFELVDGRLLEIEHRMDEHESLHKAIDADQSSNSFSRRVVANLADSFGSNHSVHSASSVLAHLPVARMEIETELETIKDRVALLEAAAMPSTTDPWEVEVILLPWGPELRGIWFSPDEPMHDSANGVTQESEEWTQCIQSAQNSSPGPVNRSASGSPSRISLKSSFAFSDTESGWSSQAISNWATGDRAEWLFPKACGNNNLVYKRLQSRGFIRDITFTSASSKDIQATLAKAFGDKLVNPQSANKDTDATINSYPGLRAPFIPLRKNLKQSRLRFLTPAEMTSSALWSAQFLTSGVIMKVSGGKRRLYVTQRDAYLQHDDDLEEDETEQHVGPWTWPEIRQLPRFQPDVDTPMEGNDEQCQPPVPEADAKEACWAFIEPYDLPPASTTSSFNEHNSAPVELSMRPADQKWRRSITPSSILKRKHHHPISPQSEFHLGPGSRRGRTVSASMAEATSSSATKRRFNESSPAKQFSVPPYPWRTPSSLISNPKRRRIALSSSPHPDADADVDVDASLPEQEAQAVLFSSTTRRSREPPSPFTSSHPELARTNSDVTSRSQKSVALAGKNTPFAYATPYSGPTSVGGAFDGGGDTEPDDDYEGNGDGNNSEQSWRGVDDEVNDVNAVNDVEDAGNVGDDSAAASESGSEVSVSGSSDAEAAAEMDLLDSFSGDDSGFGSEDGESSDSGEGGEDDDDYIVGARRQRRGSFEGSEGGSGSASGSGSEGDEVFDKLLRVLRD